MLLKNTDIPVCAVCESPIEKKVSDTRSSLNNENTETFCFSVSEMAFSVNEKCYFLKLFVFRSAKWRFRSADLFFTGEVCHIRPSILVIKYDDICGDIW